MKRDSRNEKNRIFALLHLKSRELPLLSTSRYNYLPYYQITLVFLVKVTRLQKRSHHQKNIIIKKVSIFSNIYQSTHIVAFIMTDKQHNFVEILSAKKIPTYIFD